MGRNCKLQLQFDARAWTAMRSTAETRVDDAFQTSWEVTRAQPGACGIVNCFSGGSTAMRAGEGEIGERAAEALAVLDAALPGIAVFLPALGAVSDAVGLQASMLMLVPTCVIGALILASAAKIVDDDIAHVRRNSLTAPNSDRPSSDGVATVV